MRINNNIMAMNTQRQLGLTNSAGSKSMEKLSSGLRINRAGDDAAGLSISEKMRAQIRGLNMASKNAQDGISLIQTAEGALQETHAILQRMRELAVQSSNDTNVQEDRDALQAEIDQLATEITRIAENTEFNTQNLLNGGFKDKVFHIGANDGQKMELTIGAMTADALGVAGSGGTLSVDEATVLGIEEQEVLKNGDEVVAVKIDDAWYAIGDVKLNNDETGLEAADGATALDIADVAKVDGFGKAEGGIDISSQEAADKAIKTINDAIETVSKERSMLGAIQNRLEHTIKNLDNVSENLQASESRIRDVDMAKEMMEFTKNNILQQAAQAMLAQANQAPQGVLQLLR